MKRFYKKVRVEPYEEPPREGYAVFLDGRPIKTPSKTVMVACNENLAQLVAKEWESQGEHILPDTMPVTQLVNTCLDRVSKERPAMEKQLLNYIDTDLLCYRTLEPEEMAVCQNTLWEPWVSWFENTYDLGFQTTTELCALKQDSAIHNKIAQIVRDYDENRFTIFQMLVPASGSIILALAFMDEHANVDDLMACSFAEEDYKFKLYNEAVHGGDPLTEKKKAALLRDLKAAEAYLKTLI